MKRQNKRGIGTAEHRRLAFVLAVPLALLVTGLYWHFSLSLKTPELPQPPLKDLAAAHNVDLGMHVIDERLKDKPYTDIVSSQFNFVTSDAEAHWISLRPSEDTYNFSEQDQLVAFAKEKNMGVQNHHLVWGEANWLPQWLKGGDYTHEELYELMHDHIFEVAGRYKGQIKEWTVVNEIFTRQERRYELYDWWALKLGGIEYVDKAFKWAREADPNAKLIFNDFQNEVPNSVSDASYDYIKAAKARGVPIDGLGMQMHLYVNTPPRKEDLIKNMKRFKEIGVDTYITEFDINTNHSDEDAETIRQQEAKITHDVVRACIESRACVSFSGFGVTDKNDTLKQLFGTNSRSYFFDSRYGPKPAWSAFHDAWAQP